MTENRIFNDKKEFKLSEDEKARIQLELIKSELRWELTQMILKEIRGLKE